MATQQQQQQTLIQNTQVDGKLSLLLQLHPQLRRVGIALGVEVRGGVQQQVGLENIFRWPLLMAFAEQLQVPMEQLFQVCGGWPWQGSKKGLFTPGAGTDGSCLD